MRNMMKLSQIEEVNNLEIVASTERINNYIQNDKIDYHLLKAEEELVICIKDLIYAVGNDDQTKISIKLVEGKCFKVTEYGHDTITLKSFNDGLTIRMKKKTFRYYFGVINSKGKSIKEFFNSRIFREMDCEE